MSIRSIGLINRHQGSCCLLCHQMLLKLYRWNFQTRPSKKKYLALVRGWCAEQGTIDHSLKEQFDKMSGKPKKQAIQAKDAVTHFTRLAKVELPFAVDRYPSSRYSLVEARPVTGRKHQIRRHFKHISHPIIGDAKHGKSSHNGFFQSQFNCHRLMLACTEMTLTHPTTGDMMTPQSIVR